MDQEKNLPQVQKMSRVRLVPINLQQQPIRYSSIPSRTAKVEMFPSLVTPANKSHLLKINLQAKKQPKMANYQKLSHLIEETNKNKQKGLFKVIKQREYKNATTLARIKNVNSFQHVLPKLYNHFKDLASEINVPKTKLQLISQNLEQSKVLNDYRIISHLGKGCFSIVSSAVNKVDNSKCAIKTYTRIDQMDDVRLQNIQSEVQNLFNLKHENIICLQHAIKDGKKIQLVMENGGKQSLSGLLRKTNIFEEDIAKKYFKQMVQALAFCHSQDVCHRDIKLQNMLVDDFGKVKLIDFGFSLKCKSKQRLTSYCGTPPYMSPELASRSPYSGHTSDIWALGVSLFLMLNGKFPFKAANQKQLYRLIQQGKYKMDEKLSNEAKSLVSSMLKVDENHRITARQIIKSNWLTQKQ